MKYIFFIFPLLFLAKFQAQTRTFKTPVINPFMSVSDEPNLRSDTYLVNQNYIVFQGNRGGRYIIEAHTPSFTSYPGSGIGRNKDGIFIKGNFVKTDTLGYKNLWSSDDEYFWKTKTKIYKNFTELAHLKASDFVPVKDTKGYDSQEYYQSNGQVYYFDKLLKDADLHTAVIDNNTYYDKNGMYDRGERILFEGFPITYLNSYLQTSKNHILSKGNVLAGSDPGSFTQLKGKYSKDKNQVYYSNYIIKGADVSSFVSINEDVAKDQNHVYLEENIIPDADPETFVNLKDLYFKDKNHIYYNDIIVPINITDIGKIRIWNTRYQSYTFITDGKKIFFGETLLDKPQFDAESFGTIATEAVCYDKNGIYIIDEDRKTQKTVFKKIPFRYSGPVNSKDIMVVDELNGYVFYKDQAYAIRNEINLFNHLTPEQINTLKNNGRDVTKLKGYIQYETSYYESLGKVGSTIYWGNKKTLADAESFEPIKGSFSYFKDKKNVYFYSIEKGLTILKGVDSGSARMFNTFLTDKNYLYTNSHKIIKSENVELLAEYEGSSPMCLVGNSVTSSFYVFKNIEGYWLALISDKNVEINKIPASNPNLRKLLEIQ